MVKLELKKPEKKKKNGLNRAYIASELLEILPKLTIGHYDYCDEKFIEFENTDTDEFHEKKYNKDENICNALAKMLIYLIENNLVSVEEINK